MSEKHKLIEILPSRKQEDLETFLTSWGQEVLDKIEIVSIDLWKPYKSLIEKIIPERKYRKIWTLSYKILALTLNLGLSNVQIFQGFL